MCGILGVINGEKTWTNVHGVNNYMKQGCVTGMFRGMDSTGLMQFNHKWEAKVMKATVNGYEFAEMKRVDTLLDHVDDNLATIIHHRAATQGSVSYDNCHPFEHEMPDGKYLIGVHNGGIPNWMRKEDGIKFEVDSDWLYYRIARDGGAKALGDITSGAYALVWHESDGDDKKFLISCNEERALHWAYIKDANAMLIASEASMLWWLAQRNNLEVEKDILRPKKGFIYEFRPQEGLRNFKQIELDKPPLVVISERQNHLPLVVPSNNGEYDSSIKAFVSRNGEYRYQDKMGPVALARTPFSAGQEVDLVFQRIRPKPDNHMFVEVLGELNVKIDGKDAVFQAVIGSASRGAAESCYRADECWCRVIGVRTEINQKSGEIKEMILVSQPYATRMIEADKISAINSWEEILSGEEEDTVSGGMLRGPGGTYIPVKKFESLIAKGCAHCSCPLTVNDAEEIGWWDATGGPLCVECCDTLQKEIGYAG